MKNLITINTLVIALVSLVIMLLATHNAQYMAYKEGLVTTPITDANIKKAVDEWVADKDTATTKYGHIKDWDTSAVTSMFRLFYNKSQFNDDISRWDVSNVTNMFSMFNGAAAFNQPIGSWDVSKVTDMNNMFASAKAFNQPMGNWNVSNVTDMRGMFYEAKAFNQPIGSWNVSKVTNMKSMFNGAEAFNQPIGSWDVSNVTDMRQMFYAVKAFNRDIRMWNVSKVTNMDGMFNSPFLQRMGAPATPTKAFFNHAEEAERIAAAQRAVHLAHTGDIIAAPVSEHSSSTTFAADINSPNTIGSDIHSPTVPIASHSIEPTLVTTPQTINYTVTHNLSNSAHNTLTKWASLLHQMFTTGQNQRFKSSRV